MKYTVTLFKSVTEASTSFSRDVLYALGRIRSGKSKDIVEQIRSLPKEKANELKVALPGVCFNGSFKYRSAAGLVSHSGLMVIDLDGFESFDDAVSERESSMESPYTFASWVSPSGKGVKILVKIPREPENHKSYFEAYREYLSHPNWDNSGSDVSRFCFESYDPDIKINEDSELWVEKSEQEVENIGTTTPIIPINDSNKVMSNLVEWWNRKYGSTKGSRNNNLYKLAIAFNDFGIPRTDAEMYLMRYQEPDFGPSEIRTIINSGYGKTENFGTKFFEDKGTQEIIEKLVRVGKNKEDIVDSFPNIDKKSVEKQIDSVRENLDIDEFWYYDDKNKVKVLPSDFKNWLEQNNFFKFYPSKDSKTYTFIRIDQNLVEETNEKRIKDFVLEYTMNKTDVGTAPFNFMASNLHYFNPNYLSILNTKDIDIKEDDKDTCYMYYKNCVVEIKKDSVKEIDYVDLDGFVWRDQIIDREYKHDDHHDAEYRKFIWLISGKNVEKYNSFKSVIGYLLHSFKTSANNKAIVFNDETISENPNGGSGKGLFWNAIKYMKNVANIDGKTFDFNKSFLYQNVKTDTQLLVFDDVKKNFNFESLFSVITEGITLEYKGQDAIQIPVEKSPKILITTNYTLGGVGGSHERRKFEIEMSGYFSYMHTPLEEFGHMLFSDWNDAEWSKFDNFMIQCEQYYLKNGLVSHEFTNLSVRKFIKDTCSEFYEWVNEEPLPVNERLDKGVYYKSFADEYNDIKWLTQKKFTRWLDMYGKYKGYAVSSGKSGSIRWIYYSDTGNQPNGTEFDDIPPDIDQLPF